MSRRNLGTSAVPVTCTGQDVDDAGRPVGKPCGAVLHDWCWDCMTARNARDPEYAIERHTASILASARAGGWRIGPKMPDGIRPASCPRCSKPAKAVLDLAAQLDRRRSGANNTLEV